MTAGPRRPTRAGLRLALGVLLYFLGFAFLSPKASLALVAAPLGLLFALHRPGAREKGLAALCLLIAAWTVAGAVPGVGRAEAAWGRVEAAWVCLLAGGLVVAIGLRPVERGGLVGTGLVATAVAGAMGALLVAATRFSWDQLRWLAAWHFSEEARAVLDALRAGAQGSPGSAETLAALQQALDGVVDFLSRCMPALLLIQSLAALATGWALYRRLARRPAGEPLPPLREFRFNDHLIWGIVLALVALLVPGARAARLLGGNLATFFGVLYAVRGLAVLAALIASLRLGALTALLLGLLAVVFLMPVALGALALGVSDTWVDWRALARRLKAGG